jgi:hypothetical protein
MSSLSNWFGWRIQTQANNELPAIFPLSFRESDFVAIDVRNIYMRILTDVLERTQGIKDEDQKLLWDNCVASDSSDGLVTMIARAMAEKNDLFIVFDRAVGVIRKATQPEQEQIKKDFKAKASSTVGTFITFRNYQRTDMVKLYSALEYCAVASLSKSMNLSKAIQLKLSDLRSTVSLADSGDATAQAVALAEGLAAGRDVMLDAKDSIETATPDLTATKSAMQFIAEKRSFYLGLPASYITGSVDGAMGDKAAADKAAIERGLKGYFFSVIKPVIEAIFGSKVTFESEDFEQLGSSLEALKTFELVSGELLSQDNKRILINKLFGLPEDTLGDEPEEPAPLPAPAAVPPARAPVEDGA